MLPPGLFVVHDTGRGGQDNVTERSSWEQLRDDVFELPEGDVVSRRDATTLVDSAEELDDDLAGSVVIDDLEFTNVT